MLAATINRLSFTAERRKWDDHKLRYGFPASEANMRSWLFWLGWPFSQGH